MATIRKLLSKTFLRVAIFLLGADYSVLKANSARVVGVRHESSASPEDRPFASLKPGDLVIANLTNVLEVSVNAA